MSEVKKLVSNAGKMLLKIDPNVVLVVLTVMFVVLLLAAENIIKGTFIH
ncbi:MAG: hypothetical protein Kow00127_04600 [Bacteroidales bacterium]